MELPEGPYGTAAVGVDATNGNVWTYGERRIRAFDRDGVPFIDIESTEFPWWDPNIDLVVDGNAGNVWLLLGDAVHRFDLQGGYVAALATGESAPRVTIDRSRSILWIGAGSGLRAYDAQFQQLLFLDLGSSPVRLIEWDHYRDEIWVAVAGHVRRYDHTGQLLDQVANPLAPIDANFLVSDGQGGLWIGGQDQVRHIDSAGVASAVLVPFHDFSLRGIVDMVANPKDRSVWIAIDAHLRRFSPSGEQLQEHYLVSTAGLERHLFQMDLFVDATPPSLAFALPADNTVTSDATPLLRLNYLDPASGVDLGSLHLTLNGSAWSPVCSVAQNTAECAPALPLADGAYHVTAIVADNAANQSQPATIRFIVDTIAPAAPVAQLVSTSDVVDGMVTVTGVAGSVETSARVRLTNLRTGTAVTVVASGSGSFSVQLSAQSGDDIRILVTDAADNSGSGIVIGTSGGELSISVSQPTDGSTTADRRVLVEGFVAGSVDVGVTLNGKVAGTGLSPSGLRFAGMVDLAMGSNFITIIATDSAGRTVSRTLTIVSSGTALFGFEVSPDHGVAPLTSKFELLQFSERHARRLEVDFDGNGTFDVMVEDPQEPRTHTYVTAGTYLVRARVTDAENEIHLHVVSLNVRDAEQLDSEIRATLNAFTAALAAQNDATALRYLVGGSASPYAGTIAVLRPDLSQIVASFSEPRSLIVSANYAEYAIVRELGGIRRLFVVTLVRSGDGLWRIEAM